MIILLIMLYSKSNLLKANSHIPQPYLHTFKAGKKNVKKNIKLLCPFFSLSHMVAYFYLTTTQVLVQLTVSWLGNAQNSLILWSSLRQQFDYQQESPSVMASLL